MPRDSGHSSLARYDTHESYEWNYARSLDEQRSAIGPGKRARSANYRLWDFSVPLPVAVAAGPLLNGAWVEYYARLGFDVLTYKTVRSRAVACYEMPNLQPIERVEVSRADGTVQAADAFAESWAVSFGMPSREPDMWREDVRRLRKQLPDGKVLSVSVVASPEDGWSLQDVADDYARCGQWAAESGADVVELNLSCPNVSSCDGQLYGEPARAAAVASTVRSRLPDRVRLLAKIGWLEDAQSAAELWRTLAAEVDGIVSTNCIAARVQTRSGEWLFGGARRGIAGGGIRRAVLQQIGWLDQARRTSGVPALLIACGGISTVKHIREAWSAGADFTQVATAAMIDPLWPQQILAAISPPAAPRGTRQ